MTHHPRGLTNSGTKKRRKRTRCIHSQIHKDTQCIADGLPAPVKTRYRRSLASCRSSPTLLLINIRSSTLIVFSQLFQTIVRPAFCFNCSDGLYYYQRECFRSEVSELSHLLLPMLFLILIIVRRETRHRKRVADIAYIRRDDDRHLRSSHGAA